MFGKGISREGDVLDLAAKCDVIVKSGAWYAYKGNKIGQGRENAKNYLMENSAVFDEVEQAVRAYYLNEDQADEKDAKSSEKEEKKPAKKSE